MNTNQTNREAWRKFLGIKDPSATLENGRNGGAIGRTAGRAGGGGGGGSLDSDSAPEGDGSEGAEKGDGGADAGKQLKPGDEFDRLEDLRDCETGEKVKIDGFGEKGSEQYPTGFQDCKKQEITEYRRVRLTHTRVSPNPPITYINEIKYFATQAEALGYLTGSVSWLGALLSEHKTPEELAGNFTFDFNKVVNPNVSPQEIENASGGVTRYTCKGTWNEICTTGAAWPAADRNHLSWNKEKGCFEPLCPELNIVVLDKFKACEKERILCDKDENKVKVEVDGDTVKITQAKYNQTAEFKNGKVQTVKKLAESQTEAEFK